MQTTSLGTEHESRRPGPIPFCVIYLSVAARPYDPNVAVLQILDKTIEVAYLCHTHILDRTGRGLCHCVVETDGSTLLNNYTVNARTLCYAKNRSKIPRVL